MSKDFKYVHADFSAVVSNRETSWLCQLTLPNILRGAYAFIMRNRSCFLLLVMVSFIPSAWAVPKPHAIAFGKWTTVRCSTGNDQDAIEVKVRGLFVDSRLKEYTSGLPHDVTDRVFVVRRVFRVNDSLPQDGGSVARWVWQRGGWLMVDRLTGRVSQIALPQFDLPGSELVWYRDYGAYCGYSDDGKNLFAMVIQLGRRKPALKKRLGPASGDAVHSDCDTPEWQRSPMRVTFAPLNSQKLTFAVRGSAVSEVNDGNDDDTE